MHAPCHCPQPQCYFDRTLMRQHSNLPCAMGFAHTINRMHSTKKAHTKSPIEFCRIIPKPLEMLDRYIYSESQLDCCPFLRDMGTKCFELFRQHPAFRSDFAPQWRGEWSRTKTITFVLAWYIIPHLPTRFHPAFLKHSVGMYVRFNLLHTNMQHHRVEIRSQCSTIDLKWSCCSQCFHNKFLLKTVAVPCDMNYGDMSPPTEKGFGSSAFREAKTWFACLWQASSARTASKRSLMVAPGPSFQ